MASKSKEVTTTPAQGPEDKALVAAIEQAVTAGNLALLSPPQRLFYYKQVCESVGLNPLTRPLDFITLNGKLVLYAKKDATDQIRRIRGVSITRIEKEIAADGMCMVTAYARDKDGKEDCDIGALPLPAGGENRANAIMKCITKAKRRVTLSICGLGLNDETELEGLPGAKLEPIDLEGKTQAQTESLKDKVGAINPAQSAKQPPKEPEVLPPAEKPAQKAPAKPAAPPAAPAEVSDPVVELGKTVVPREMKLFVGKKLEDLKDDEVRKLNKLISDLPGIGPAIAHFVEAFREYIKGFDNLEEPEAVAEPAAEEEDPAAFFEQETEEPATPPPAPDFRKQSLDRIRGAKTMAEWAAAMNQAKAEKDKVAKLPGDEAKAYVAELKKVSEETKAKLAAKK